MNIVAYRPDAQRLHSPVIHLAAFDASFFSRDKNYKCLLLNLKEDFLTHSHSNPFTARYPPVYCLPASFLCSTLLARALARGKVLRLLLGGSA